MSVEAEEIREAFLSGQLRVKALDPQTGEVGLHVVSDVMQHHTSHKSAVEIVTESGVSVVSTGDHSVYTVVDGTPSEVRAEDLNKGDPLVVLGEERWDTDIIHSVEILDPLEVSYDLCVPGPENFFLMNGVLAHNSYSIGGISLDVQKSSNYESLKNNAEAQFDKATEAKARTVKYTRGLQQPRFGRGVRSSFGPFLGRGILSPRNFW